MRKYGNWINFKSLARKDKIFRITNLTIMFSFLLATIGLLIYFLSTGDKNHRLFSCIGMIVVFLIPFLYEVIFRRRIKNLITFYYLLYSVVAGFIGSVLSVYDLVWWYDILVHILAGYTFCFLGIIILSRLEKYNMLKPITIILFCFFCTLAVELVWELMEWFADSFLGQNAQGGVVPGYNAPLVTDTDLDMLCNLTGGIVFVVQFLIGKYTKYSLGVNFFERELCPQGKTIVLEEIAEVQTDQTKDKEQENEKEVSE